MNRDLALVSGEHVRTKILILRGQKVLLDRDLADLYGVDTKVLNQAVRRNVERFPADFMLQLSPEEFAILRSQLVTSSWGGSRHP
ncbi:MAG TPA: ORF6N domain-containing protein, partial [Polyangia bacterium]